MHKIQKSLSAVVTFDFDISISYGITLFCQKCDIDEVLKQADKEMYKMKNAFDKN